MTVPIPDRKEATLATVYNPPKDFRPVPDMDEFMITDPDLPYKRYDYKAHDEAENLWIKELADEARRLARLANSKGAGYIGEVVRFPRGDGSAMYLVWKTSPLELIHLPVGDAWQIPDAHSRGLRLSDIKDQIDRERRLTELFAKKES